MDIPTPPQALATFATFVRDGLAGVSGTIAPIWREHPDRAQVITRVGSDSTVLAAARQFATVVVGAAAPFAPTSYARARLIRQMHASGLLSAHEAYRVAGALDLDTEPVGDVRPGPSPDAGPGAPR